MSRLVGFEAFDDSFHIVLQDSSGKILDLKVNGFELTPETGAFDAIYGDPENNTLQLHNTGIFLTPRSSQRLGKLADESNPDFD